MKIKRKEHRSEQVGYKHPPFKTRWRKGQTGNPHGRPKKDDSLRGIAEQELRREVLLRENGQARRVSLKVAIIKRCLADAAQGKIRNLEFLVKLLNQTVPVQADTELTPAEQELWNSHFKQIKEESL